MPKKPKKDKKFKIKLGRGPGKKKFIYELSKADKDIAKQFAREQRKLLGKKIKSQEIDEES